MLTQSGAWRRPWRRRGSARISGKIPRSALFHPLSQDELNALAPSFPWRMLLEAAGLEAAGTIDAVPGVVIPTWGLAW